MQNNPHNPMNKNKMHPDDRRNMVIFFFVVVGLFLLYDIYVKRPHIEKLRAQQELAAQQQSQMPQSDIAAPDGMSKSGQVLPLKDALAKTQRIKIDSETITGSLSLKGGRIDLLALKQYFQTTERKDPVVILAPARSEYPQYADFGWIGENGQAVKTPTSDTVWAIAPQTKTNDSGDVILTPDNPVVLSWDNGAGLTFRRRIALDDRYAFDIKDQVTNNTDKALTLFPYAMISRVGLPPVHQASPIIHEGPLAYLDGELYEPDYDNLEEGEDTLNMNADTGWIGITEKYWFTALLPEQDVKARYNIDTGLSNGKTRYHTDYTGGGKVIEAGETVSHQIHFFAGPKVVRMLEDYSDELNIPHFDLAVDFGIFYFMTRPFFTIVTWIGHTTGSFAIAILVFTVMLRLAVFPLANKSFRSFARMRKISPQMVELREKYGSDRAKLQQEIFALYQRENVNPMAGCLPILIQIPIFFSLYKVLYMSIEMRHTPFWGWIDDMSAMDPTNIFTLFGLIPWDAPSALHIGIWPMIMGATMLFQQRLNPPAQDPIQQKMMMFMPFMITFILAKFPAGLVIYWSWSNFLSMIQQVVLMKKEGVEVSFFKRSKAEEKLEELVEHGPSGVSPAAEMIEEDIEDYFEEHEDADGDSDAKEGGENKTSKPKTKGKTSSKNPAAKKKSTGKTTKAAKGKSGIKKPSAKKTLKGK